MLERTPEMRRVKIKSLSPDKNLAQMAEDIIEKCKYIHPSRIEEIEQLLIKLRKYLLSIENTPKEVTTVITESTTTKSNKKTNDNERDKKPKVINEEDSYPIAKLDDLDEYLDMLYQVNGKSDKEREDSLKIQIKGTYMILQLCRSVMNLETLIQNNTVMGKSLIFKLKFTGIKSMNSFILIHYFII